MKAPIIEDGSTRPRRPLRERASFFILAAIMITASTLVMTITTVTLYWREIDAQKEMLQALAQTQARLIESIASYDARAADPVRALKPDHNVDAATLNQIQDSLKNCSGFGETGEFVFARREADQIVFVMRHRHAAAAAPEPVAVESSLAEPMRQALAGGSGTITALDYRGEVVIAAYEPIDLAQLAIVAKIDLAEIRTPFIRAGLSAAGIGALVVLAGTVLFFRVSTPLIARLESARELEREMCARKRTEKALRESEDRYRAIVEDTPVLLCRSLADGRITFVNEAYCRYFSKTSDELVGSNFLSLIPESDREAVVANLSALTSESPTQSHEHQVLAPNGELRWQRWSNRAMFDAEGRTIALQAVGEDITDRKRIEAQLAAATVFLDTVLDMSPFAMWVSDANGTIIRTNRSLCEKLEVPEEQIVGKYNVLQDENLDAEGLLPTVRAVFDERKPARFSLLWRSGKAEGVDFRGGRDLYVDAAFFPIVNDTGKLEHVVCQWLDITEHKRAEEALAESQATLQAAMDACQAGIAIADAPDGRLRYVNEAGLLVRGGERAEAVDGIGMSEYVASWKVLHLDGTPYRDDEVPLTRAIRHGETSSKEFIIRRSEEDDRVVFASAAPVKNSRDEIVAGVVAFLDVTKQKQIEAEREDLIGKLEAQNAELEQFTYTVSHDLRSPLVTIKGYVGMLRQDLGEGDSDAVDEDLGRIADAADKMDELLRDVLELSRIGRVVNEPEEVPLEALAQDVLLLLDGQIREVGASIEIASNLPVVYGDRLRLREVLQNLLDNALKYMGDQPKPRIEIGSNRDHEKVVYYVRDNGIGIDPKYYEKIFGLFDQLSSNANGSGVGLALTRRIIETHGGRIWVESEGPGQGATFYFTLAAKDDTQRKSTCEPGAVVTDQLG